MVRIGMTAGIFAGIVFPIQSDWASNELVKDFANTFSPKVVEFVAFFDLLAVFVALRGRAVSIPEREQQAPL